MASPRPTMTPDRRPQTQQQRYLQHQPQNHEFLHSHYQPIRINQSPSMSQRMVVPNHSQLNQTNYLNDRRCTNQQQGPTNSERTSLAITPHPNQYYQRQPSSLAQKPPERPPNLRIYPYQPHTHQQHNAGLLIPVSGEPKHISQLPAPTYPHPATNAGTPNFHNISKNATNLLNDIYEKHLLTQTRFDGSSNDDFPTDESSSMCGGAKPTPAASNFNFNTLSQQQQRLLIMRQQKWVAPDAGSAGSVGGGVEMMIKNNLRQRVPRKISESVTMKLQRCLNEQQMALAAAAAVVAPVAERRQPPIGGPDGSEANLMYEAGYMQRPKTNRNSFCGGGPTVPSKQHAMEWGGGGRMRMGAPSETGGYINGKISGRTEPVGGNIYLPNAGRSADSTKPCGGASDTFVPVTAMVASAFPSTTFTHIGSRRTIVEADTNAAFVHRNSKINIMLETAQAVAAAAHFARAANRMSGKNAASSSSRVPEMSSSERGGFCGALQRAPPPMPAGLARRLATKDNFGAGKVKVMLRISDMPNTSDCGVTAPQYLCADKKKRQVTLTDPATMVPAALSQERGPMVAAPKMFAFDGMFTGDDTQADVCASALSEVVPAVLEGSDACLLTLGYPGAGQTKTMFGSVSSSAELGAIPSAIAWLFKGINERRQHSGSRFSVRVSALGISATRPGTSPKDLLAAHKTESDESPSSYLRDDYLGGPTELRAPTAERAALYLDAALAERSSNTTGLDPALIFTLHVYQYSLGGKDAVVAGGRSRLHLIDLGGCANRSGGLPLSGIGNVLLAILSGQRHPPNRDHPLTPLLKDCLAPLSCHVSVLAHVSHTQTHTDALTTIQLASRIHRMRRRKHRFPLPTDKQLSVTHTGNQSGSSDGPDPSSSDLSADTVIYMGPCDDATDGEHPPVYLPSMSSGDNRCAMNRALKGSAAEKPSKIAQRKSVSKPQSPVPTQRTDSLKRNTSLNPSPMSHAPLAHPGSTNETTPACYSYNSPVVQAQAQSQMPKIMAAAAYRHVASNVPSPKGSPIRRPPNGQSSGSPHRQRSGEEQWVDGPRLSKSKVAEARHLLREINHVKQKEQWIDGPKMSPSKGASTLAAGPILPGSTSTTPGYGYMDSHKKTMIRQWVENQTSQIFQPGMTPAEQQYNRTRTGRQMSMEDDQHSTASSHHTNEMVNPVAMTFGQPAMNSVESSIRIGLKQMQDVAIDSQEEEDQDSGPSEVPPALPLIEPLSSREISHDSIHRMCSRHVSRESLSLHNTSTKECGLQVTEDDIVRTMGDHPLSALSNGNMSAVSSFNNSARDAISECLNGDRTRHQFDQLARLRELYTSQLAMAEVVPAFRINDACSVFSEPAYRFIAGNGSVCSEPAYRPPSPLCSGCRKSISLSRTPSQISLPSLDGLVAMEQYASLRHPDGASDPNLRQQAEENESDKRQELAKNHPGSEMHLFGQHGSVEMNDKTPLRKMSDSSGSMHHPPVKRSQSHLPQLPSLPLMTQSPAEAYDSGRDSSTPRTSKHSGISRRAESGYHSVATVRDSDESSFGSAAYRGQRITAKKRSRQDRSLCNWLRNPFTCTYPDTEGEISDF